MPGDCPRRRGPHRFQANRLVTGCLGIGPEDRSYGDVVDRLPQSLVELIERVRRHADDGIVPDDGAGLCRRQIILSEVHAGSPRESRNIGAIVHDDRCACRRGVSDDRGGRFQEVPSGELLRPDLQQAGATRQARRRVVDEGPAGLGADIGVADDVEMRWLKFQI
jgi:hypothetical protein